MILKRILQSALTVLVLWMVCPIDGALQAQSEAYSLDDWMTVTAVRSFVWSPDGQYLYFRGHPGNSGTTEIFRVPVRGGEPQQLSTNFQGQRPEPKQNLAISADGNMLFFTTARYFQSYENIFTMAASGGEATAVTFNDGVIETDPQPSPDGRTLAYFARTPRGMKIFLKSLNEESSWPQFFSPGDGEEHFPVWSPDGTRLAFSRQGDIWIGDPNGEAPRRLIENTYAGGNGSPAWSPDGNRIAFVKANSGFSQVGVADVGTGSVTPITHEPRNHGDVAWSPDGGSLVFVRYDEMGMSREVVVTNADGSGRLSVMTQGKGIRSSPRYSPDGNSIAYIESTGIRTPDLWLIPAGGGTPRQLTNSMGRIDPADLSMPEEVSYPGPDNLQIPTLLYKPKNFDPGQKYPVIVRLHGHPGQWNHSFQLMWQYFIQKGFVLIAPNPRGSRGFGQGFHDLHIADYGGTEFEDVMNVLNYLQGQPYVDLTRKATWGGSGGGYMSLVIATKAPTAFQAQIIRAPVSSWKLLAIDRHGASGRHWTATRTPRRERSEFGGAEHEIPEEYRQRSPLNFVENVETPQLLFHGLRDTNVPPRQSKVWVERMRELGKGQLIEYIEYPDEDHSLNRYRATIRDRLLRMEQFLAKHLRLPSLGQ